MTRCKVMAGATAVGVGLLMWVTTLAAGPATQRGEERLFAQGQFSRYVEADGHPRLETAIFSLSGEDGVAVDLVAAVHIGDAAYYRALNDRFTAYDAVLYEMVSATMNPRPPARGQGGGHPIGLLQRGMKAMMGLTFQLDEVDYSKPNFVHADMDARTFYQAQARRGESLMGLMLQAYREELLGGRKRSPRPAGPAYRPIDWGVTPASRQRAMKLTFAQILGDLERQALQLDGPEGSAILTDRNDACLKVFRAHRKAGVKRMAIFYGAAHLPDLATKLVRIDGLTPGKTQWLTAWDIPAVPATRPAAR